MLAETEMHRRVVQIYMTCILLKKKGKHFRLFSFWATSISLNSKSNQIAPVILMLSLQMADQVSPLARKSAGLFQNKILISLFALKCSVDDSSRPSPHVRPSLQLADPQTLWVHSQEVS